METDDISNKKVVAVIYALYAASLLIGITAIAAIVINYIKRDEVAGTWLESHFQWQIRTFWFSLLWSLLGVATVPLLIGWIILPANVIWFIYRIAKGWLWLNDNRALYQGTYTHRL